MCVTSNVLVMFSSFEIFDVISYKVVFIVYLIDFICILSFNEVIVSVSYTHLRAHETVLDLVCRLLLEKKKMVYTGAHSFHTFAHGLISRASR